MRRVDIPRGRWHEQENGKKKAQVKLKHGVCVFEGSEVGRVEKIHFCQLWVTGGRLNMYPHSFLKPQKNDSKGIKMAQTNRKEEKISTKLW